MDKDRKGLGHPTRGEGEEVFLKGDITQDVQSVVV